jgi:hypothetical protein
MLTILRFTFVLPFLVILNTIFLSALALYSIPVLLGFSDGSIIIQNFAVVFDDKGSVSAGNFKRGFLLKHQKSTL